VAKTKPPQEEAVHVGADHHVTIPSRISRALRLKKGDHLMMRLVGSRVEMVPAALIAKDQLWFWSREWQEKEREADEDVARRNVQEFDSVDKLIKDLKS
jgi:antitoxin MazE